MLGLVVALGACAQEDPEGELETSEWRERCESSRVDVDLQPIGRGKIFVELCLPAGSPPSTALLLLAGATYSRRYWDIRDPNGTNRYSFVKAALAAGYATVAVDRIGIGQSSHPPSAQLDIGQNVNVTHQLVQALRSGDIAWPGPDGSFDKVVLVGNSLGSVTSFLEASQFQDVDGLVLTGATHRPRAAAAAFLLSQLEPANQLFRFRHLDPGYLTTRAGSRDDLFYAPSTAFDSRVVLADELTKETVTLPEFATAIASLALPLDVRVPTFLLMGQLDSLFCSLTPGDGGSDCSSASALIAQEGPLYGAHVPCIEASVTPGAGHVVNAFFTAGSSYGAIIDFLDGTIGADDDTPGC
jgi:pimeloyl-ACP methyl ester carboxylesterase